MTDISNQEHHDASPEQDDVSSVASFPSSDVSSKAGNTNTNIANKSNDSGNSSISTGSNSLAVLSRIFGFQKQPVPPLLEDVDHVVSSRPEEAREVLRGMVSDLLRENDSLTKKLQAAETELLSTKTERDSIRDEYQEQLLKLQQTVERGLGNYNDEKPQLSQALVPRKATSNRLVISPEKATEMIVQNLSRKVEELNMDNSMLEQDLAWTRERMEDLDSLNEARLHTIEALETMFLNKRGRTRRTNSDYGGTTSRRPLTSPLLTLTNQFYSPSSASSVKSSKTARTDIETPERLIGTNPYGPPLLENSSDNPVDESLVMSPGMGEI